MSFIIMTASTKSSRVGWSKAYRRVAVVEIDDTYFAVQRMRAALLSGRKGPTQPSKIDPRARGLIRIVETWEHLNVGLTAASAYRRALVAAEALCARLNREAAHRDYFAEERLARDFD